MASGMNSVSLSISENTREAMKHAMTSRSAMPPTGPVPVRSYSRPMTNGSTGPASFGMTMATTMAYAKRKFGCAENSAMAGARAICSTKATMAPMTSTKLFFSAIG